MTAKRKSTTAAKVAKGTRSKLKVGDRRVLIAPLWHHHGHWPAGTIITVAQVPSSGLARGMVLDPELAHLKRARPVHVPADP